MTKKEFAEGVKLVQSALQGTLEIGFVDYLWKYFQGTDTEVWRLACVRLAHGSKPARNLVFRDFLAAVVAVREEHHRIRKHRDAGQFEREGRIVNMSDAARDILKRIGKGRRKAK